MASLPPTVSKQHDDDLESASDAGSRTFFTARPAGTLPYWDAQRSHLGVQLVLALVAAGSVMLYSRESRTLLLFLAGTAAGLLGTAAAVLYFTRGLCRVALEPSVRVIYYLSLAGAVLSTFEAVACARALVAVTDVHDPASGEEGGGGRWVGGALQALERFEGLPPVLTLHVIIFTTLAAWSAVVCQKAGHAHRLLDTSGAGLGAFIAKA